MNRGSTPMNEHPDCFKGFTGPPAWQDDVAPYVCKFSDLPSWVDPSDQEAPPDYCHEAPHP